MKSYYSTQQGCDISGGGLTIDKLALTGTIATGTSTYGSSLSTGTASFTNVVGSDSSRVDQRYLAW